MKKKIATTLPVPPPRPAVAEFGPAELEAADAFLQAKATVKAAEQIRDEAKAVLLLALGDLHVGLLPDGRTVRLTSTDFPDSTFTRKAYTARVINID